MYIPAPPSDRPDPAEAVGELGAADGPELQLFGNDGLVAADAGAAAPAEEGDETPGSRALFLLLVMATATGLIRGTLLLSAVPILPDAPLVQAMLVSQWLVGTLLVVPLGFCVHRLTGRMTPTVIIGLMFCVHPDVLNATLSLDGGFWALPPVALVLFLCFGRAAVSGQVLRPVPGLGMSAVAGLLLGLGGLVAAPVAVLAVPLAFWRLVRGLCCAGPGRGPRDVVAAVILVASATIPLAAHQAVTGEGVLLARMASPHGEVIPRLIENRWPTLQARLGLSPGLDLIEEVTDAFAAPPPDAAPVRVASSAAREAGIADAIARHSWSAFNAALLCGSVAAAGLAIHRRRGALGLLMILALPLAVVAGGVAGEQLRLTLLPLELLMIGVFWLPARRFRRVSAVFNDHVKDAGFTIKQDTVRVL